MRVLGMLFGVLMFAICARVLMCIVAIIAVTIGRIGKARGLDDVEQYREEDSDDPEVDEDAKPINVDGTCTDDDSGNPPGMCHVP